MDSDHYDRLLHPVHLVPGSHLAALYPAQAEAAINSIHHQAVKDLGRGMVVEAQAPDGQIEAWIHVTPAPRTNALTEGATLVVRGDYTFPDVNADGISDLWEERFLGGVAAGHRPDDDRDGDGATDLAEFLAGSNPTNAVSVLRLLPPSAIGAGGVSLKWESALGHAYRVWGSSNAVSWMPMTDWIRAAGTAQSTTVPAPTPGTPYLYQLQVEP